MRNCLRVAILPTLFIVCMFTLTSAGNDESRENAPAAEAEMRQTIAVLKLRIAELEAENQSLRQQVHRLNPPAPDLTPTSEPGPAEAEGEAASPQSEAEGDQPVPNRKTFRSGAQILRDLPGDLRPKPGVGWDKFTWPKRDQWLNENIVGHLYETRLTVRTITVARDSFRQPPNNWTVTLDLLDRQDDFAGLTIRTEIGTLIAGTRVSYRVDEADARRAERLQPGYLMHFRGRIKSVNLLSQGQARYRLRIELDERDITAPFLPVTP